MAGVRLVIQFTADFRSDRQSGPGEAIGLDLQGAQVDRARRITAEQSLSNVRFESGSV